MPTDDSINGYRKENTLSETAETTKPNGIYYANTQSKKFHFSNCTYAERTNNDNLYLTEDREELILTGYAPCKICNP